MRVLHVQKVKGLGGSERHLASLLPGLQEAGVEIRMWAATSDDGHRFVDALSGRGVDVVHVGAGPHLNPELARSLRTEIRRFRPTLVHTHLLHGDVYGQPVARACGVPGISSFHSVHGFFTREPIRTAERLVGRLAHRTIAISQYVQDFLLRSRLRSPESVRLVPYGLDPNEWQITPAARARARETLGLHSDSVAVGVASRLIPGKGHNILLAAFANARADVPALRLLIAGDGPLRADIEVESRRLGSEVARVLGFVSDMRNFMASCDIVVFPTLPALGEGFGLAALEAMAAERPVVATRVASLPEIVVNEETGILVPPGNAGTLSAALVRLATNEDLRDRMGRSGSLRADTAFGLDRMVAATLSVYRESTS
jgi:glycosyltransferase involved in cell wall biosynthesis